MSREAKKEEPVARQVLFCRLESAIELWVQRPLKPHRHATRARAQMVRKMRGLAMLELTILFPMLVAAAIGVIYFNWMIQVHHQVNTFAYEAVRSAISSTSLEEGSAASIDFQVATNTQQGHGAMVERVEKMFRTSTLKETRSLLGLYSAQLPITTSTSYDPTTRRVSATVAATLPSLCAILGGGFYNYFPFSCEEWKIESTVSGCSGGCV
jgi:Flp pilus assembly protein TadG